MVADFTGSLCGGRYIVSHTWLKSYITGRTQFVPGRDSEAVRLSFDVPQGSFRGPVLFTIYIKPLSDLIAKYPVNH